MARTRIGDPLRAELARGRETFLRESGTVPRDRSRLNSEQIVSKENVWEGITEQRPVNPLRRVRPLSSAPPDTPLRVRTATRVAPTGTTTRTNPPPPSGPAVQPPRQKPTGGPTTTVNPAPVPTTPTAVTPTKEPPMATRANLSRFQPVMTGGGGRYGLRSDFDVSGAIRGGAGARARGGSWVDAAVGAIAGGLGGGGSEPPQGSAPVPGNLVATGNCPSGQVRVGNNCVNLPFHGAPGTGVNTVGTPAHTSTGEAVLGRYGVAMVPGAMQRTRLRCPRGMVLGMDDLCYNKRDLRKDERKWVPGRKPLLTGGELNAISTAMSAAKKLDRQKKKLKATARAFERAS